MEIETYWDEFNDVARRRFWERLVDRVLQLVSIVLTAIPVLVGSHAQPSGGLKVETDILATKMFLQSAQVTLLWTGAGFIAVALVAGFVFALHLNARGVVLYSLEGSRVKRRLNRVARLLFVFWAAVMLVAMYVAVMNVSRPEKPFFMDKLAFAVKAVQAELYSGGAMLPILLVFGPLAGLLTYYLTLRSIARPHLAEVVPALPGLKSLPGLRGYTGKRRRET